MLPAPPHAFARYPTTNGPFATGDGHKLAAAVGASLIGMDDAQAHTRIYIHACARTRTHTHARTHTRAGGICMAEMVCGGHEHSRNGMQGGMGMAEMVCRGLNLAEMNGVREE